MFLGQQWESLQQRLDAVQGQIPFGSKLQPPRHLVGLLIAGEDHRFYQHHGVDPFALCRAAWKTYWCDERQGGSTIAMQLVRTLTGNYEKSVRRKLIEIALAIKLTRYVDKDRIPVIYIWVAYYGSRMSNFRQACSRLNLRPDSLTIKDAALLVARLKYPEGLSSDPERSSKIESRALYILDRAKKLSYQPVPKIDRDGTISGICAHSRID